MGGEKMALFDVVRFDGLKSRDWVIYKFPSDELVMGTQLIVQEGQTAIFVRGGKVADVFSPGTYTLSTDNLPVLKTLVKLPFGRRTPFSAEIYFVNTTVRLDMNWGTSDPVQLIDPKYHVKLRVRAFGQMGVRVVSAETFFREVIGGMPQSDLVKFDKISEYFRGILVTKVKSAIADQVITNGISVLELSAKLESLSSSVKKEIEGEFTKYGLETVNFFIKSINFPDEDFENINRILEDRAAFEIMGDSRYQTKRSYDIYEKAASNENGVAGVLASGGVGLGAAIGIGSAMKESVGNPIHDNSVKTCAACGKQIPASSRFCPECGKEQTPMVCSCGYALRSGTKFCPQCGKKVM